jgi:hypothetical protein
MSSLRLLTLMEVAERRARLLLLGIYILMAQQITEEAFGICGAQR